MRFHRYTYDFDEFTVVSDRPIFSDDFILGMLFSMAFPNWPIFLVVTALLLVLGGMIIQLGFIISYIFLLIIWWMICVVGIHRCRSKLPVWVKLPCALFSITALLALPSVYLLTGGSLYSSISNVYKVVWIYIGVLLVTDSIVYFMLKRRNPFCCIIASLMMLGAIIFLLIGAAWSVSFYQEYSYHVSTTYQHVFAQIIQHTKTLYNKIDFLGCRAYANQ